MASTIDQLKSLFQKAKKKTLDATDIDERLGQGLRSVGDRAFNAARVTDNRLRNNLQQNAGTRSYGQAFGKSFLDTPQTLYDSLQKTGITKPFGNLVRSTVTPLSAGAGNYFQGVNTATTAQGGLAKLKGGLQALKGGGQVAAGINPLTYAATSANTLLPQGVTKRLLTGGLRGFTQTGINPETEAKNINTPLGSFDPVMGVGEMVGFVKNPVNAKLFKGTEKRLPTAKKTVGAWLGSNSIRGAIEQIALDLPEMPDNMNAGQKAEWLAKTIGIGAVSELVGQGVMQGSGKVLKKVGDTKLGKVTQEQASKLFDYLATARRRNTIPVRRSLTETVPMWREKLSIKRTNTPEDKRVLSQMGYGSQSAAGGLAGAEPYQDENGNWKMRFNPEKAALGIAAMGGIKAIKGNKAVFGNMKPVEFDGKYTSGDISKLTKSLDEALGTESFNGKGKWTSEFAARGSAKKSLEFDATQSPEAKQLLDYVNGLEQQIAQAQGAKNTYTFKVKGGSPTTQTVTTPQGKKLTIKTEPLAQSPATLKVIGSDKTLPVTPNLQQTPRVTQQAPTSQLDAQLRPTSSPDVRTTARPTVQAQSWKKLSSDKLYSQETADARIADAFDAEMNAPQDFKQSFARFIGNKDAARTRGTGFASQEVFTRVPKEKAEAVIRVLDGDVTDATPEVKAMAAPFRKAYDQLIKNAQESGIPIRYWKEYIPHFWKEDPQEVMQMFMTAKGKFANAKTRTIPTYSEGIAMGLTPQYTHPAQILEQYVQGLERVKAGMNFIKELDSKGIIVPASVGRNRQGFKQVIAPGIGTNETAILDKVFVGNFYAPAKVADQLNKLFTEQEPSALAGLANATGKFQDIYLSGGVPGTPINAFTFGQAIKETTAGRPVAATKAVVRSFFPGATNKYFREKAPVIEAMQRNNIPIQTTLSVDELIDAPTAKRTFGEKVGRVWSKVVNEATFKRFMPSLQVDMFDSVQKGALKAGKSATEAEQLAAKTVKQFYGVTDSATLAARSPLVKDAMTSALFAPRFRESMLNFWANNAKALRHPFAPENKYNMRFLVGLGLTYAGYDALNYANTGNHLWENPEFKKDKALIPLDDGTTVGVPLLPSVAYLPRTMYSVGESLLGADFAGATGEAMGLISPLAKPVADLVRNKDYFGKQIIPYDAEGIDRWKAAGTHLATQYSGHPYVRELFDPRNQEDPAYQRISRAMEAPLRFYDSKLNGSIKVKAADTSTMSRVEAVKAEKERFDTLGKLLDKYENNPEKAVQKAAEQGFSAEDVQYYDIAREENDIKTAYVLDTLDSVDDKDMIKTLEGMRKKVGDKLILADGVIDDLYNQDLITSAQKKYLKSLDYEKGKDGKYTLKKKSGKAKKIKIGSTPTLKKISIKAPQVAQMAKIDFKIPTSSRIPIRNASTSKPRIKLKDASKRLLSVVR